MLPAEVTSWVKFPRPADTLIGAGRLGTAGRGRCRTGVFLEVVSEEGTPQPRVLAQRTASLKRLRWHRPPFPSPPLGPLKGRTCGSLCHTSSSALWLADTLPCLCCTQSAGICGMPSPGGPEGASKSTVGNAALDAPSSPPASPARTPSAPVQPPVLVYVVTTRPTPHPQLETAISSNSSPSPAHRGSPTVASECPLCIL